MIVTADAILRGRVLQSWPARDSNGEIVTHTLIGIEEALKGEFSDTSIELVEMGGFFPNEAKGVSGVPQFRQGEDVLVFVKKEKDGSWRTHQLQLGKFELHVLKNDSVYQRGKKHDEIKGWDPSGKRFSERARRTAPFLRFIRNVVRGTEAIEDYFVDEEIPPRNDRPLKPAATPVTTIGEDLQEAGKVVTATSTPVTASNLVIAPTAHFPPSAYSMGGPARWSTFDGGGSVNFAINGTQPGYDGPGAAQRGAAAWTNEPNSVVRYTVSGTTGGGFSRDGVNSVIFNSPSSVPSGAVALGQWYASGQHTYKGETFYTVVEGDVIVGSGFSFSQKVFDEVMTHELGHTLSFRHSNEGTPSTTVAVMNSIVSGNYGASLAPYDVDAVTHMYGSGGIAVPNPGRTTVVFTDDPLVARSTVIKAIHITQLRQAVNEIRANAGLGTFSFTDPSLAGVRIKAVHITELRTALDQARSALGLSTGGYTDPAITLGVTVAKAIHIQELRDRMK